VAWKPLRRQVVFREAPLATLWKYKTTLHLASTRNTSIQNRPFSNESFQTKQPCCWIRSDGWESGLLVSSFIQWVKWSCKDKGKRSFPGSLL
jgi:hypothetical protein